MRSSGFGFGDIRWQRDADGPEHGSHLAAYRGTDGNAASVLLDFAALQAVEITQERTPLGFDTGFGAAVEQLLVQHQGEEGAEDVAADGGIG